MFTSLQTIDAIQILECEGQLHVKKTLELRFLNARVGQSLPTLNFVRPELQMSKY